MRAGSEGVNIMRIRSLRRVAALAVLAFAQWTGVSQVASAGITPYLTGVTPDSTFGNNWLWTFAITATSTDGFYPDTSCCYFTISGLPGSTVTVEAPEFWQASGNSAARSVTFKWGASGAPEVPGSATSYLNRSPFRIFLTEGTPTTLEYEWQNWSTYPYVDGQLQSGRGIIPAQVVAVPEPTTLSLLALGLAGIGLAQRHLLRAAK